MKKRVALILSMVMLVSITACDSIPKIPHIGREDETSETTAETTTAVTEDTEPTETEEPAETTAEPTKKPQATATPTPTPKQTEPDKTEPTEPTDPDPDPDAPPAPVVIITEEDEEDVDYGSCIVTHVKNGRSWRYEGLPDILTFSDDLITIEIPGYDTAARVINDTLSYMNEQAEDKFKTLQEDTEIPPYPQKKEDDENGGKKNKNPDLEDPTWSAVVYSQTANVVLVREKIIGIRYEYSYTDAYGNTSFESEYLLFDLRTGDYLSSEDLARSSGLFSDHLYYMSLALFTKTYPETSIDEDTFAKELVRVKDSYQWEIVDKDGSVVLQYSYPEGAFAVLGLEDRVFEADFEQFSMYFTSYFRSLFD